MPAAYGIVSEIRSLLHKSDWYEIELVYIGSYKEVSENLLSSPVKRCFSRNGKCTKFVSTIIKSDLKSTIFGLLVMLKKEFVLHCIWSNGLANLPFLKRLSNQFLIIQLRFMNAKES